MEISSNTTMPYFRQEQGVESSFSASETRMASISESQSLDMLLVTAEGDKVTLSYDAYAAALYAEYGQIEATENGFEAQWAEFAAGQYGRELTLSIEGDLNHQERYEIGKAIKTLGCMLDNVAEGDVGSNELLACRLSRLETIEQLDVSMAYEQQMMTAQQTDMALVYGQSGEGLYQPALPAEKAVQAPLQTQKEKLVKEAVPAPLQTNKEVFAKETVLVSLLAESEKLAKEMAEVVRAVKAPWDDVVRMTKHLFDHHRKMAESKDSLVAEFINNVQERFKDLVSCEKESQSC